MYSTVEEREAYLTSGPCLDRLKATMDFDAIIEKHLKASIQQYLDDYASFGDGNETDEKNLYNDFVEYYEASQ